MDMEVLFSQALGIEAPWKITRVEFDSEAKRLDIHVDFERGATFDWSDEHGKVVGYKAYDTVEKIWRHLNFFEHECYLIARTPRIKPDGGGVKLIMPPWAGVVGGFTLLFEALIMKMCANMPVRSVGKILNLSDKRLWRILDCYVLKGSFQADYSQTSVLGIDETSLKKGHNYISLFVDLNKKRTVYVTEGKGHETVLEFAEDFTNYGGTVEAITDVSCDMSPAFIKGVAKAFPKAEITFDRFHITKLINEAVDKVRRSEVKEESILKGTRFVFLKNLENLSDAQKETRQKLSAMGLKSMRALHMRENFQKLYKADSYENFKELLEEWYNWVSRCHLLPMMKVAKTIRKHWDGILRWKKSQLSNGILEGLNSVIQAAKRKARGYKLKHFKVMALLLTGNIDFKAINPYLY